MKPLHSTVRPLLQRILSGEPSHRDLAELVQLSRALLESHIAINRSSLSYLCANQGLTIADLAYDCIAEAFVRDTANRFTMLENFSRSLNAPLEETPELEVFLAFKQFLLRIGEAQLARLYAQSDPAGAKIHRNIRECVKSSEQFTLGRDFRGLVLHPAEADPLEELPEFPPELLEREFAESTRGLERTPELLSHLHEILTGQSDYCRSISLIAATQLFKKFYSAEAGSEMSAAPVVSDGLTEFELEQMQREVEFSLKEKIFLTYLARGKVKRHEADAMLKAFQSLLQEFRSDGVGNDGLYHHLNRHLPLSPDLYEELYRPKMEYLLKIARDEFARRLVRDL